MLDGGKAFNARKALRAATDKLVEVNIHHAERSIPRGM